MNESQQPVFYDSSRKRQIIASIVFYFVLITVSIALCGFFITIVETPNLSTVGLSRERHSRSSILVRPAVQWTDATVERIPRPRAPGDYRNRARLKFILRRDSALTAVKVRLAAQMKSDDLKHHDRVAINSSAGSQVTLAFYANDDGESLDSLTQHREQITHFAPAWLTLSTDGKSVIDNEEKAPGSSDQIAEDLARKSGMVILPVLQNFWKGLPQQHAYHALVETPANRAKVIGQLLSIVTTNQFQGINIDLESFTPDDPNARPYLTQFMTELYAAFHAKHLLVTQDVSVWPNAYDLPALAQVNDFLVPMIYDEHWSGSGAGPIASNNWFREELSTYMQSVPASKTVIGLAGYSYDWTIGSTNAVARQFGDASQLAQQSMDGTDGIIQSDGRSGNPYFTYYDDSVNSLEHIVWMQDAVTAYNQLLMASQYHPRGAALWRLGQEDPSIWSFLGKYPISSLRAFDVKRNLSSIDYGYFGVQRIGTGDIISVIGTPKTGERTIQLATGTGLVHSEVFTSYPSQYVVRRTGILDKNGINTQKVVALTFDDGPDPRWTPQILSILHHYHVPATFFVVGENAEANPGLVQREWNEGMEIGNHSFTHPEMDLITPERIRLELDATQRVIEAITGHESKLFRAPNRADSDPSTRADLAPVIDGDNLGYTFVGESIDPNDWRPGIMAD
jgi:spore germination protein YaaH